MNKFQRTNKQKHTMFNGFYIPVPNRFLIIFL